ARSIPSSTPIALKIWPKPSDSWPSRRSTGRREGPDTHRVFAAADLLLATIDETEQLRAVGARLEMRDLDHVLADGDGRVKRPRQPLQPARHVRRIPDDGERQRPLAADRAHHDRAEVHADARIDRLLSGGAAGLVPVAQTVEHVAGAMEGD